MCSRRAGNRGPSHIRTRRRNTTCRTHRPLRRSRKCRSTRAGGRTGRTMDRIRHRRRGHCPDSSRSPCSSNSPSRTGRANNIRRSSAWSTGCCRSSTASPDTRTTAVRPGKPSWRPTGRWNTCDTTPFRKGERSSSLPKDCRAVFRRDGNCQSPVHKKVRFVGTIYPLPRNRAAGRAHFASKAGCKE